MTIISPHTFTTRHSAAANAAISFPYW